MDESVDESAELPPRICDEAEHPVLAAAKPAEGEEARRFVELLAVEAQVAVPKRLPAGPVVFCDRPDDDAHVPVLSPFLVPLVSVPAPKRLGTERSRQERSRLTRHGTRPRDAFPPTRSSGSQPMTALSMKNPSSSSTTAGA